MVGLPYFLKAHMSNYEVCLLRIEVNSWHLWLFLVPLDYNLWVLLGGGEVVAEAAGLFFNSNEILYLLLKRVTLPAHLTIAHPRQVLRLAPRLLRRSLRRTGASPRLLEGPRPPLLVRGVVQEFDVLGLLREPLLEHGYALLQTW